ncbi:MAG: MFS transporter [Actinomycetota bacterium]|nr:MFS transporter [Actinomycetota bacterium]
MFSLVGGVLGDRCSRRAVMLGAAAARALTQAATAALVVWGRDSLWALASLQAASGVACALFSPAATGLLVELVPKAMLRPANSLLQLSRSLASILALGAAGFVVAEAGAGVVFGVDAASYMISTLSLALLGRLARSLPPPAGGRMAQAREGWRAVRERQWLWTYVGHVALLNTLAVCPFFVLGPLVAQRQLGGAAAWAAIAMGYAAGAFGASLVTLRRQPARPMRSAYLASLALSPLLVLLAVSAPLWSLILAALCAGAQSAAYNVWATATLQTCLPASLISRASSVVTFGSLVAVPAGMSLSGLGADTFGTGVVLALGAVAVAVLALVALGIGGTPGRAEAGAILAEAVS